MKMLSSLRPEDCQLDIRRKKIYAKQKTSIPRIQIVAFPSPLEIAKRQIQAKLLINTNRFSNYLIENNSQKNRGQQTNVVGRGTNRFNRARLSRMSQCPRSQSGRKESLYDKSLQKSRGRKEKNEFQRSVREIGAEKYICLRKADSQHSAGRSRCNTENSRKGQTIIIELKKLYQNQSHYSFVKNQYDKDENQKQEYIFSTSHTNPIENERGMYFTNSMFDRTKYSDNSTFRRNNKRKSLLKKAATVETQLNPWMKQSQRVNFEGQNEDLPDFYFR